MAVPNSGPLGLRAQIGNEFYGNVTGSDISIHEMSQAEGFATPDTFSEFYGYTSVVTITLDGGQSRTGSPGASGFGTMNYNVNSPSGTGFTNTDAQNASINSGLPAAFTANFTRTGQTSGRWGFTTPDGNFPDDSYALQTTNMTIQNPSSPLYNLTVQVQNQASGTYQSTVVQGQTASINASQSQGQIGIIQSSNSNWQINPAYGWTSNQSGGAGSISQGVNISKVLNANSSGQMQLQNPQQGQGATGISGGINAPPWPNNPITRIQFFAYAYYFQGNLNLDNRVSACLCVAYNSPGGATNNCFMHINVHRGPSQIPNQFFQIWQPSGTGNYCVSMHSNHIFYPNFGNQSPTWGWC